MLQRPKGQDMAYQPSNTILGKVLFGIDCAAFFVGFLAALLLAIFLLCYLLGGLLDGLAEGIGKLGKHISDIIHNKDVFLMITNGATGAAFLWLAVRWRFSREVLRTIKKEFTKKQ
jgi:hypothetical protein